MTRIWPAVSSVLGIWNVATPVSPATAPAVSVNGTSFLNNWVNTQLPDGSYSPLRYRKRLGNFQIVGCVSGGNFGSAIIVLPTNFRPTDDVEIPIVSADGSTTLALSISASTGVVTVVATASASLPASGVTPGTYGNATHLAQITVNAQGIVTAAMNISITAGVTSFAAQGQAQITGDVTISAGPGVTLIESGQNVEIAAAGGGIGSLIGLTAYTPGSDTAVLNAGAATTETAIDATNAVVTFTTISTAVLIRLSALCSVSTSGQPAYWGLLDGSTLKSEAWCIGDGGGAPTIPVAMRKTVTLYISGLTNGQSYTYKWAYRIGAAVLTHSIFAGPSYGPLVMEVIAA